MAHEARKTYSGPPLLSAGFRPFFLMGMIFVAIIIPLWLVAYLGFVALSGPFAPIDWHIHEMMFGYTAAVLTGFLFTAIPNWTGRLPVRGWPLALLTVLWIGGRFAMIGGFGDGAIIPAVIDCAFLAAITAVIFREIIAGNNWKNLIVAVPVLVFLAANILFHIEVMEQGNADYARRLSVAVPSFLIMLIGGRVIPSFTRNWLAKQEPGPLPSPFGRFDTVCLLLGAGSMAIWVIVPEAKLAAGALVIAAVSHLVRLSRWQGTRTTPSMLLLALHVSYGFIALGLLTLGLGAETSGFHLLGIGGIGGMTLAVMVRATLGHSGRALVMGRTLGAAFILVVASGVVRSVMPYVEGQTSTYGLILAASLWSIGFVVASVRLAPIFWSRKE